MELTNEEKMAILNQHLKSIVGNIYNLQVSLIAENALEAPDQSTISSITLQIEKEQAKKDALMSEVNSLD
jgi:hypothetical protein